VLGLPLPDEETLTFGATIHFARHSKGFHMSTTSGQRVLLFLKVPGVGRVKTRLAAEIGQDRATELYRCFVEDIIAMLDRIGIDVQCCYEPAGAEAVLSEWLGGQRSYAVQVGDDLGRRMEHAFRGAFREGVSQAVLIGSDIPDLAAEIVELAFTELGTKDVVIGPSSDGGYYLLGFRGERFVPEVFEGIRWSTDHVFDQTTAILSRNGLNVSVLPVWHDVDTRSDLDALIERNRDTAFQDTKTFNLIQGYGWNCPGKENKDD
jgi:uncharacterized protein